MGKLTDKQREALPDSDFVFQKDRRYPIHTPGHGVAALAFVNQKGTPAEKTKVRSEVCKRYPGLTYCKRGGQRLEEPLGWKSLSRAILLAIMTAFAAPGYSEEGKASWYGPGFNNRKTASGEIFRSHLLTAAHKKLPLGTMVKVEYGTKSVVVKINDRGPFVRGRIIDLSEKAAEVLGLKQKGVGRVKITVI